MDNDFILVLGVFIGAMAAPALVSSFSAGRSQRATLMYFVVGGGLISWAIYQQPNTYSVDGMPNLIVSVLADIFR